MASSASLCPYIPTTSSQRFSQPNEHNRINLVSTRKRKVRSLKTIKSVLNDSKLSINDNGSARILLERLFEQTKKLEEQMIEESPHAPDFQLGLNLQDLESDLQAALVALKKKEEHLEEAERRVLLENSKLKHAKEELERQEIESAAACSKYEKLEKELNEAGHNLTSQASQIKDLKHRLTEKMKWRK